MFIIHLKYIKSIGIYRIITDKQQMNAEHIQHINNIKKSKMNAVA